MNWNNVFIAIGMLSMFSLTTWLYEKSEPMQLYRAALAEKVECESSLPRDKVCVISVIVEPPKD